MAEPEIVWSKAADRDIGRIYGFYEDKSLRAARKIVRRLFEGVDLLLEMPRAGALSRCRTEQDYRELVIDHFKIFYSLDGPRIVIARVWDTRQDPSSLTLPQR
jgi:plasmid stabilization system protein ParE